MLRIEALEYAIVQIPHQADHAGAINVAKFGLQVLTASDIRRITSVPT
jgi:hypothetical protein